MLNQQDNKMPFLCFNVTFIILYYNKYNGESTFKYKLKKPF